MSSNQYDVIVLGAGASGLMTAYMAAERGRKVLVLEKAKIGRASCRERVSSPV